MRMLYSPAYSVFAVKFFYFILLLLLGPRHIQPSTYTNVTAPPVRLLGGEGTIPKSSQYVTAVTDITQ